MRRRVLAIPSVLAALATAPARAADNYVNASRREAERVTADFARCEVRSDAGRAAAIAFGREVAGTPSDYPQRLIKSPCAPQGSKLSFQPRLFRLMVFPALYARDYGKAGPTDFTAAPPADYAREFDGTPDEETLVLRRFGDCVVRLDGRNSRAVVLSKMFSDAERTAFGALQGAMGKCLPAGQQLRFSRSVLRGAIGEALYKLTAATAATKAG